MIQWDGAVSTEERVALDVPLATITEMVRLAAELGDPGSPQTVLDAVARSLGAVPGTGLDEWAGEFADDDIRTAVGATAKAKTWFKRTDLGEGLGEMIAAALPQMEGTDLREKLAALAEWAYAP